MACMCGGSVPQSVWQQHVQVVALVVAGTQAVGGVAGQAVSLMGRGAVLGSNATGFYTL